MAPTLEDRVKSLKAKRGAFKVELEQFKSLLDAYEPGSSISEIRIRFEDMESEYALFCKTQGELDTAEDSNDLMLERITLKVRYATCKARAVDFINHSNTAARPGNASVHEPGNIRESPVSQVETVDGDVRLPKINLPTFSGEYEDWPGFSDQFKSSVHDKAGIDDCKKLMYLRSCLKNEAAKDIKSLGNSASNYKVAWDILEKRYNQPAIIVANHLQSLFDAPLLQKSSHRDFRTFISATESHYRALQVLEQPTADTILIHLLLSKLDKEMVVKWKECKRENPFPSIDRFFEFLHDRCNVSEPLVKGESAGVVSSSYSESNRARQGPQGRNKHAGRELRSHSSVLLSQAAKCSFCPGSHASHNCEKFVNLSVAERFTLVKEKHLCFNCLRGSHSVRDCQASTCRQCHKRHHTLLHFEYNQTPQPVQVNSTCSFSTSPSQMLFGTAVIDIIDTVGKATPCRVLLDSCAASHFLSARMCKLLKLNTQPSSIQLRGTNAMTSAVNRVACATIKSRYSKFAETVTFLVVKEVSKPLPQETIDQNALHIPAGIRLADPNFNIPGEIDAIIGGQCFWDLLCVGRKTVANHCKLQKTQLGWVVVGQVPSSDPITAISCNLTLDTLQADVHKFGEIEESEPECNGPHQELQELEIPEQRKVLVLQTTSQSECQLLTRFSSFSVLNRVVAYCRRFFLKTHKGVKLEGPLTVEELQQAHCRVMRLWQNFVFLKEMRELSNGSGARGINLSGLCPFVDKDGLLRVGGRLQQSQLPFSKKHPLIIPQRHHCTELIIREAHIRHGHSGAQGTLNAVRQMYWPINGLVAIKAVIRKCVTCSKLQPITPRYPMGQLPKDRVTCSRPFLTTGVDYCGPFFIKEKKHRNTKRIKVYVAVFVCFCTRAVHIELVSDLTTDAFLAALKRFIARRGKCTDIYSDNGTNFVGADRELKRIHQEISAENSANKVYRYLLNQQIRWHFIPPRAPHFGGVWEAAVKSLKRHLVRILGNTLLTFEEFTTCLVEIEAMLNSRPLTPLSSDPNDLVPLTPGHFIIGDSLTSTPECDLTCVKTGRLSSWQHLQQLRQHFWTRWYKEYLNELTVRKKFVERCFHIWKSSLSSTS